MGKRIFFTGGSGKAGRHAVPWLVEKGYEVSYREFPGGHFYLQDERDTLLRTLSGDLYDIRP